MKTSSYRRVRTPVRPAAEQTQTKLKLGAPSDAAEKEADTMANKVTQGSEPSVQRKCAQCDEKEKVQREATTTNSGGELSASTSAAINATRGKGDTMGTATRSFMESGFGSDFSSVNIHTDGKSAELNEKIGAKAFTVGNDIYFNQGQYNPNSAEGKRLLAHELTHTLQQGKSSTIRRSPLDCTVLGGRPPSQAEETSIVGNFPNLKSGEWCILGDRDGSYNCHAYSAGKDGILGRATIERNWGDGKRPLIESEMDEMYLATRGLLGKSTGASDAKVAVFTKDGVVKHSAKLVETPYGLMAESKLGGHELILHDLFQLEGGFYGNITRYYY